jgi:hypothetical protein
MWRNGGVGMPHVEGWRFSALLFYCNTKTHVLDP